MMNIDFRFIIIDFWKIQDRRSKVLIIWMPLIIIIGCIVYGIVRNTDPFVTNVTKTVSVLIPLLALMLTGITFLTSCNSNQQLKTFNSGRVLRKKHVSLYEYMVINFSYVIVSDLLLLLSYVIAGLFSMAVCFLWALIMNSVFTFFVIHILLVMLVNIGDLFFVLTKR